MIAIDFDMARPAFRATRDELQASTQFLDYLKERLQDLCAPIEQAQFKVEYLPVEPAGIALDERLTLILNATVWADRFDLEPTWKISMQLILFQGHNKTFLEINVCCWHMPSQGREYITHYSWVGHRLEMPADGQSYWSLFEAEIRSKALPDIAGSWFNHINP